MGIICLTRDGYHLFVYPFEGRLVHEGLAALIAYRLSRLQSITFTLAANDYGFELIAPDIAPLEQALDQGLFSTANLYEDILASLNAAEMSRRQFREVARVAGLVLERYPGGHKTMRQLQASSGLLYDVIVKYDSDNRLLEQAEREVMQRQLESSRLHRALTRITAGRIHVQDLKRPTPFAFPLLIERMRQTVSSETLEQRIHKMQVSLEKWADTI
jgi:ATP-dependent helicase Lhr and Lhr-like helicase